MRDSRGRELVTGVEIELAAAVQAVRDELTAAAAAAGPSGVRFGVGPIELELALELRLDAKVGGKVRAWVVTAEGEAGTGRTRTHRVRVTLQPQLPGGGDYLISNQNPLPNAAPPGSPAPADGRADGPYGR
ncbi:MULTISPECIES: trypco2 family protein [Streptomyces]|uniref:Trypsin-co-occurring domain-containing protein n=1 Tax=Streptomyces sp. NBC_00093 TaxID=2975649 RepID=A0AAU1ZYV5_9ACTN